ncbi:glutathione peroxidase [Lyngbya confervoides]|uniref:Glutathione peroxidase n=1 Tax=Lyngbya confervoides BDU141951 TaxID=1574623 RepID=A0ABD4T6K0_9CYAN|nr:glutathione peroxidase [Lyngbya confervoides]MCM1984362.1 glutathione peroxidase [Lyngbya confervoides BDU141951]
MTQSISDISVQSITGQEITLGDYAGKVLLLVNVASYCGYTSQYAGLQQLYDRFKDQGFEILAFPCNDYGQQEPDSLEKIQQFCSTRYSVTFPLFEKVHAKGADQHPLYQTLTQTPPAGEVAWNFEKFLVNKNGEVVARFKSAVSPDAPELVAAIENALS